ncbi:plasmid mobilization relaxosome protein MobC [Pontibacter sp. BT731]|uniref:plasmid mobilization protein n=1 Tax=Pontibacter coccineus TaxID=3063328 RepID=UPI0026E1455D|nr:plasmid mobilization relaxosome protein MobC [Pontibacter sp. BT731]MDO6389563.1 plasmid mobilization relaxosome protein MobC [Pontibacter sp. BT731]
MEKETAQRQQCHEGKKGGRPLKRVKRSHILVVRVTDTERLLIAGKAREAGLSVSAWFRAAAKKAVVVARLRPEEAASLRMLAGLSNNLNQLTRLAHRQGLLSLQGSCRQLLYDIHHILQQLGRDDRKGDDR